MSERTTNSDRPLRRDFSGGLFYPASARYRVIDLKGKQDRIVNCDDLLKTLNQNDPDKGERVLNEVMIHGFYEAGPYRIEVWD